MTIVCSASLVRFALSSFPVAFTGKPEDRIRDRVQEHGIQADELVQPPILLKLFLQGKLLVPNISSILMRKGTLEKIGGFEESDFGEECLYDDQALLVKAPR